MPAPGYGYDASAPTLAQNGPTLAADGPQATSPAPGILSGGDAQSAFTGADGPAEDDKPPVRYTIG